MNSISISHHRKARTATDAARTGSKSTGLPLRETAPFVGNFFSVVPVLLGFTTEQLAVPQSYPLGQQPGTGPALAGQRNHPSAQVDDCAAGRLVAGTTMVAPLDTIVVDATGGQLVVWQSRPVWQHPPPAVARQP